MLALTRKKGESIMIGDEIEIKILSVSNNQVKLGVNAPKEVIVHRNEIYQQIMLSNKEAVNSNMNISNIAVLVSI